VKTRLSSSAWENIWCGCWVRILSSCDLCLDSDIFVVGLVFGSRTMWFFRFRNWCPSGSMVEVEVCWCWRVCNLVRSLLMSNGLVR